MRLSRLGIVTLAFCLSIGVASAGNISFTGTFTQDDQLELLQFTASSASVVIQTWGYAGGTNANGLPILPGGFDPFLSLFDANGGLLPGSLLIGSNNDGAGVAADPVTGYASDSLLVMTLLPGGTYVVVLSQNDNWAYGPTYGDGFHQSDMGNFTASENGCSDTAPFCTGPTLPNRTGNWAVDILGVDSAADISAPEPGSMLLLATGLTSLMLLRRRGKQG
jgi:hypothetical protein